MSWIESTLSKVESEHDELKHLQRLRNDAKKALDAAQVKMNTALEAQRIFNAVMKNIQGTIHLKIAEVVNRCLEAVFPDPYVFEIVFEEKRGRTEARFVLTRHGLTIDNPLHAVAGGVIDVVSFALRVAALILTQPHVRPLLVLDEPFKHVSSEYREACRDMMEIVADDLGFQIIMVTHDPSFQIGTVIDMRNLPGVAT